MIPIPKTHIAVIRQVCASGPPDFARRVPPPLFTPTERAAL